MPYGGFTTNELATHLNISRSSTSNRWRDRLATLALPWSVDPGKTFNQLLWHLGGKLPREPSRWTDAELCALLDMELGNQRQAWCAAICAWLRMFTLAPVKALAAIVERSMQIPRAEIEAARQRLLDFDIEVESAMREGKVDLGKRMNIPASRTPTPARR